MAISVLFFNFAKRENSTAIPFDNQGVAFSCNLKADSGVVNPRIILDTGMSGETPNWNYCRIREFGRYYYINDWTWTRGVWEASLSTDVLASYRVDIRRSFQYVLRSASRSDGTVQDKFYPLTSNENIVDIEISNTGVASSIYQGVFVIGVINSGGPTGIVYYVVGPALFQRILGYMLNESGWLTMEDISINLAKAIVNPFQYIVSVMWFPFPVDTTGDPTNFKFGWWDSGYSMPTIGGAGWKQAFNYSRAWPNHPQIGRGDYMNTAPFTEAYFTWAPFGTFPLNYSDFKGGNIVIDLVVDAITGVGTLRIAGKGDVILARAQIGVPVQISQQTYDYLGSINSMLSGLAGTAAGVATGNPLMGVAGAAGAIGNVADSMSPRVLSQGGNGSFDIGKNLPRLQFIHHYAADDDNESNGRPLCKRVQLADLSGFTLTMNANISINGTSGEARQIKALLDSGVYLE